MAKIPPDGLQEIFFGSSDKAISARLKSLEKNGLIKKIAHRIYTSKLNEEPAIVIRRNWYHILSNQYPKARLSHRSALEFKPTPKGNIYLVYTYTNNVHLPGLTIHFLKGEGQIKGDTPLYENLYVSQEARAYLENMEQARKRSDESKCLTQEEIEEKLETIIRVKGESVGVFSPYFLVPFHRPLSHSST